jgi:diguanylate cyclase
MNRLMRPASFLCAALGLVALVVVPVVGAPGRLVGGVAVVVVALAAVVVAARIHRLTPFYLVGLAFVATSVAVDNLMFDENATVRIDRLRGVVDVMFNLVMAAVLISVVNGRRRRLTRRDAHDALTLLVASALAVWTAIAHPLMDRDIADPLTAVILSAHLPLSVLLVGLAAALISSGLERNMAAWMLGTAMVVHLVGDVAGALARAEIVPTGGAFASAAYLSAFLLAAAAVLHPSSSDAVRPSTNLPIFRPRVRIVVITIGLAVPVALIAAVPGSSVVDHVVRALGGVLMVTLGAVRLHQAMHASNTAETRLLDRSRRDELTKLPNRRQILETAAEVLDRTWRAERRPAIMQINVDRFKNINDTLGHDLANDVLVAMAERLTGAASDFGGTVARIGGDEFMILDGDTSTAQAVVRAEEVRAALGLPFQVGERTVFVTASIGLVVAPRNRTITPEELFRRGDIATHRAKANGRNCIAMFDESMQASLTERMDIENALYGAIDRHELRLYHQPIVDVATGGISGLEALIRWRRGDGMTMRPDQFIPIAEETGLINEIGAWAMLEALTELRRWIDEGVLPETTTMSVNVSPRQIADPRFTDVVSEALSRSGVPAHLLWLEVTESMMISEPELAKATLRRVRAMGVRIALDDFGTGYSSLSILQHFPIQRIKIDRAFVNGVAEHSNDRSLVRTIIAMGTSLGLDIVAEGVESIHQLGTLRELGCSKAQGYLISHPVPPDAMRSTMTALKDLSSLAFFASGRETELATGDVAPAPYTRADLLLDN